MMGTWSRVNCTSGVDLVVLLQTWWFLVLEDFTYHTEELLAWLFIKTKVRLPQCTKHPDPLLPRMTIHPSAKLQTMISFGLLT